MSTSVSSARCRADTYCCRLCIVDRTPQDANKQMLLSSDGFIRVLVDMILLDTSKELPMASCPGFDDIKTPVQRNFVEALAQLAVYAPARRELLQESTVVPALEVASKEGLSAEARELAAAALLALSGKKLVPVKEGQKHVLLSCE